MISGKGSELILRTELRGDILVAHLSGRFGHGSYGEAFTALRAMVRESTPGVVLDLEHLDYLSSAGLAAIVRLKVDLTERKVVLRLAAAPPFAARLLEASGMTHTLPLDVTVKGAVDAIRAAGPQGPLAAPPPGATGA